MLQNEDIIIISEGSWNPERGAEMSSMFPLLFKDNRILYAELPTSSLGYYKSPRLLINRIAEVLKGVKRKEENVYIYTLLPPLPLGNRYPFLEKINAFFLALLLKRAIKSLSFKKPILFIQRFNSSFLVDLLPKKISCYLAVDDYSFTADPYLRDQKIVELERQLLSKVNLVFATAEKLYQEKKEYNVNTYLAPNAADFSHFQKALLPSTEIPAEIKNLPKPIIGFVGTSPSRIDFALLEYLAKKEPKWSFVLIGHLDSPEAQKLKDFSNFHLLGWKDYRLIPDYLKGIQVCIIPFKVNPQTDTMNLVKLYEYIAAGKPVVSTPMAEVKNFDQLYPGLVEIGESNSEFHSLIQKCLSQEAEPIRQKRQKVAAENTWEKRLEKISDIIYSHLGSKSLKPNDKEDY